jgi:hypothetical protein
LQPTFPSVAAAIAEIYNNRKYRHNQKGGEKRRGPNRRREFVCFTRCSLTRKA